MKTVVYIEDGLMQLILTPENKFEKDCVSSITSKDYECDIYHGDFYACQGGWTRQRGDGTVNSLILKAKKGE